MKTWRFICSTVLATLVIADVAAAQAPAAKHHHYKLVDLASTFGGPESGFAPPSCCGLGVQVSEPLAGIAVGFADTSAPDPFPNFCFFDCYVVHAFQAGSNGRLTDLGALPGGGSSTPTWITANGLVAGISENGETDPLFPGGFPESHAVLWQQGKITDLGTLPEGGYQSQANAVNSYGQVVGAALNTVPDSNSMAVDNYWFFAVPYGYQLRAFLWDQQNGMLDLGTLPGGTDAQALFINEQGQVFGVSYTGSTPSSGCPYALVTGSFIWEKGKGMTNLGGFGGTCTIVNDLNNQGQVVGASNIEGDQVSIAFLWGNGKLQQLGGSLGGSTGAFAINDAGEAVGFGCLGGVACPNFHATLWKNVRGITDLGVVANDQCSFAAVINASGQVAGSSISSCTAEEPNFRAFLWENGSIFDLNTLIPQDSTLYLTDIFAISDLGEMAGQGVDPSGNQHAFLLIPCDENHPGIEGCDYSFVESVGAVEAHATQAPQTPVSTGSQVKLSPAEIMARYRSLVANRHRRSGVLQQ